MALNVLGYIFSPLQRRKSPITQLPERQIFQETIFFWYKKMRPRKGSHLNSSIHLYQDKHTCHTHYPNFYDSLW